MRVIKSEPFPGQVNNGLQQLIRIEQGRSGCTDRSNRCQFIGAFFILFDEPQVLEMAA
jgi:hypothetical protein